MYFSFVFSIDNIFLFICGTNYIIKILTSFSITFLCKFVTYEVKD